MTATPDARAINPSSGPGEVPEWVALAHGAAGVGAAVLSGGGTLLWANPAMIELVRRPGQELINRRVSDLVNPSDREQLSLAMSTLGPEHVTIARVQGPTPGSWLHVSLSQLPDEIDGQPAILAQAVDVTESIQSQVSLEVMSQNVLDVVTLIDASGTITWASPSVQSALGREPDSLPGLAITELIAPEDLQSFEDALAGAEPGQGPTSRTVRFRSMSGAYRYRSVTARPVADTGTGRRTAIAMRDVTEERRAKRELARSEEQFRMAMLGAPEGMAVTDSQDRIVQVNPALTELKHYFRNLKG